MDDHKLLHELNLTTQQLRSASRYTLYSCFTLYI